MSGEDEEDEDVTTMANRPKVHVCSFLLLSSFFRFRRRHVVRIK